MRFADLALARRLEAADAAGAVDVARAHARLRPDSGATFMPIGGGQAIFAGIESPVTQVIGMGLNGSVNGSTLEQMEAFFHNKGARVNLELCPLADTALLETLAGRGYRLVEHSNVLIRPLSADGCQAAGSSEIGVHQIAGDEVDLWAQVIAQGFLETEALPRFVIHDLEAFFNMSTSTCLLAGLEGQPAGGGVVATYDGVASLFAHSTLPDFRNRGVQAAIIHASLAVAAKAGCNLALACTLPGSTSQRNLERYGFTVVYTRSKLIL